MLTTDKTLMAPAMGGEATIIGMSITCPICKTENAPTEKYCGECGFLLASTPVEEAALPDTTQMPRMTDASGREYLLKEGENSIGRESTDVLLTDPTVSRRHAKVTLEAGKAFVEDAGSSNGTYADGTRLQPGDRVEVADGGELKFGSAVLTILLPASVEVEAVDLPVEEAAEDTAPELAESVEGAEPVAEVEEPDVEAPAEPEPVSVAKLVSEDKELLIMAGTNTLGRRSGNTIVLDGDPYVSGAHAEISADDDGLWLTDVGSTNGTVLNGTRLQPNIRMALKTGDEIVFGQTAVKLEVPEPVSE
jgi:pSer/pThr/pTyr-binding forkhead associated (FHA) protein